MRWSIIPFGQIQDINRGCSGFVQALSACVLSGSEPDVHVTRVATSTGSKPLWSVEVIGDGCLKRLDVDVTCIEAMTAIVPIYLVEFVQSVREELGEVFEIEGFERGVDLVVPYQAAYMEERPS